MTRFLRILPLLAVAAAIIVAPAAAYKVAKTPAPPSGADRRSYTYTFATVGGTAPHTFAVIAGSLPPGLSLASDGALSGTPTQAGSFSFYVEAVDSATPTPARTQVKFTIDITTKLTVTTAIAGARNAWHALQRAAHRLRWHRERVVGRIRRSAERHHPLERRSALRHPDRRRKLDVHRPGERWREGGHEDADPGRHAPALAVDALPSRR